MKTFNWLNYWKSKSIIKKIPPNYWFSEIFLPLIHQHKLHTSLEIGGYPGYYSIWLKKYSTVKPTLIDTTINQNTVSDLCQANDIAKSEISIIKGDVFKHNTTRRFDLVFSVGLIEHFSNPSKIIHRHWDLVSRHGVMLLAIPNFLGLNGVCQLLTDPENLQKHNLSIMRPKVLSEYIQKETGYTPQIFYYGGFNLWFEHPNQLQKTISIISLAFGYIFRVTKINSKLFSPYLVAVVSKS